jgi:hypothetical protein
MSEQRKPSPPPEAVDAALETLAEELHGQYPQLEVQVLRPGQTLPAGAVRLPAMRPDDVEAILDRPARDRRRDADPLDQ